LTLEAGVYRFHAWSDDGVHLWVNDQPVINAWYDQSPREIIAEYLLGQGTHNLRVEYYEHAGNAQVRLWWEKIAQSSYHDWKGEYWPNWGWMGSPALVRNDQRIDFDWGGGAPASGLPADNFSVRWTRNVEFDSATYRFHVFVDDGARLWVDGQLLIDSWYDHMAHEVTAEHSLVKGTHSVRVEYYEHTDQAQIRLWWEKVSSSSYPDWKGEYWSNRDLSGSPTLVRNDRKIDFNWGKNAAAPGLPVNNFSARWSRQVNFDAGIYRFYAQADDGISFYVDSNLSLDEWHDSRGNKVYTAEHTLTGKHQLVVEYYEHSSDAWIKFWWELVRSGPSRR
jgi:hypothetical protein